MNLAPLVVLFLLAPLPLNAQVAKMFTVTAVNRLQLARQNETIALTADDLARFGEKDLNKLHVRHQAGDEVPGSAQSRSKYVDDFTAARQSAIEVNVK